MVCRGDKCWLCTLVLLVTIQLMPSPSMIRIVTFVIFTVKVTKKLLQSLCCLTKKY